MISLSFSKDPCFCVVFHGTSFLSDQSSPHVAFASHQLAEKAISASSTTFRRPRPRSQTCLLPTLFRNREAQDALSRISDLAVEFFRLTSPLCERGSAHEVIGTHDVERGSE